MKVDLGSVGISSCSIKSARCSAGFSVIFVDVPVILSDVMIDGDSIDCPLHSQLPDTFFSYSGLEI